MMRRWRNLYLRRGHFVPVVLPAPVGAVLESGGRVIAVWEAVEVRDVWQATGVGAVWEAADL